MRIGFGYDIHKLVKRRKLILGGVTIPHKKDSWGTQMLMSYCMPYVILYWAQQD